MEISSMKEVYFGKYCPQCKYYGNAEEDDPCYDCLVKAVNENSHKPVEFEEKEE